MQNIKSKPTPVLNELLEKYGCIALNKTNIFQLYLYDNIGYNVL